MLLCYRCYLKNVEEDEWDTFDFDGEVRRTCEACGLKGVYVREVKLNG